MIEDIRMPQCGCFRYSISILDIEDMHRLFSNATSAWGLVKRDLLATKDGKVIVQAEKQT